MPEPKDALQPFVEPSNNSQNQRSEGNNQNSQNDFNNKYQSLGSETSQDTNNDSSGYNNNYVGSFNVWMGTAYNKTKEFAVNVKDKVNDMDLGTKIKNAGFKTYEVVKDAGSMVANKGTEAAVKIFLFFFIFFKFYLF